MLKEFTSRDNKVRTAEVKVEKKLTFYSKTC